ncbi:chemotaxis protein CheA [Fuchsiella alkaliacetigena]|uniref:chemotaxis protein CheA n=1 Tax=Fuchsiella alkaliacetigena TaxID=957042 RepID=UPI00200AA1F8|nr:chemotaxis protein CheA [Fuchsiella alkaliacetigena]MCK8823818.1 chemotaxis protein CheA [Fuchsiella alkaliacetigena]
MDTDELKELYATESREHLEILNTSLLDLESNPNNLEIIKELFRAAHTLKGMAGTMGFEKVSNLTHVMENILDRLRNQEMNVNTEIINRLFEAVDTLEILINEGEDAVAGELADVIDNLKGCASGDCIDEIESTSQETVALGTDYSVGLNAAEIEAAQELLTEESVPLLLKVTLEEDCAFRSLRAKMVSDELAEYSELLKGNPPLENIEDAEVGQVFHILLITEMLPEDIAELVVGISEIKEVETEVIDSLADLSIEFESESTGVEDFALNLDDQEIAQAKEEIDLEAGTIYLLKVTLDDGCVFESLRAKMVRDELDELGELIKGNPALENIENAEVAKEFYILFVSEADSDSILEAIERISEIEDLDLKRIESLAQLKEEEQQKKAQQQKKSTGSSISRKLKSSSTIRVDVERLDDLMNLVAELVIKRTQVESVGESYELDELNKQLKSLGKVTTELQDSVMKMRMVPINIVFNRFPRMIRDLAQELNKEINLEIEGEETELDRTIIDEIGDPLVHIIRNAVDHGIESPEERKKAGKDPVGTVKMSAFHEGNNVIIEIKDDGGGINPEYIKQEAVSKGVVTREEAENLSDQEIINLIFSSGFSTTEEVSDVSGRGVGMDVVKNKIESLSGSVDIYSQVGVGSTFTIKLPLTLAIIQGFLIEVVEQKYVLPLDTIQEIVKVTEEDIKTIRQEEVIQRRGTVVPLISLREELNKPSYEQKPEQISVVVVRIGEESYGLIVDSIIGQQEVVIKRINDLSDGVEKIAGATILGDGSVALIIDIEEITHG